jgi:Ca2+-binding RTX toxin-like protein
VKKLNALYRTLCPLVVAASCGTEGPLPADLDGDFEGIEEASQGLSDLTAQCSFVAGTGFATLALATGDVAMVSKLSSGALGVNGYPCAAATTAALKKLIVTGTGGDQTLILDYLGGVFGAGIAANIGVDVDLGGGTGDSLKFRGTKTADAYVFGSAGITINTDTIKDITFAGVENFVLTLTDGDDSFSGAGSAVTGGSTAFTAAITVYGGAGNDTLRGGDGADTINGGLGNDTFTTGAVADGGDTLNGGGGNDTADYSTRTAAVKLINDGNASSGANVTAVLGDEGDKIGTDVLILKGGMGGDTLTGGAGADTISGGPGDDTIAGAGGTDILNGDAGNDTFDEGSGSNGGDVMNGGAGTDLASYASRSLAVLVTVDAVALDGESGELDKVMIDIENVTGGGGNDVIVGSAVDNVLTGGLGNDSISGGLGNDTLIGSGGNDTMAGDAGDDTFSEGTASNGGDTMTGGAGIDKLDYSLRTATLEVTMDGAVVSGAFVATASGEAAAGTVTENDLVGADVENLIGGDQADELTGNAGDNQIEGGIGDIVDTIKGLGGDDVIDGGLGDDIVDCGLGEDIALDLTLDASSTGCEL